MGGAIRDSEGELLRIYWGCIDENTNNVADLKALLARLDMVTTHGWYPVILEGDSKLILQMEEKLLNSKLVHKVAHNWHMAHNLEKLRSKLISHSEV